MGCGLSRNDDQTKNGARDAKDKCNFALATYISNILGLETADEDVTQYVLALRLEGFDTAADIDDLTIDELKAAPFNFKKGHLRKVHRSRTPGGGGLVTEPEEAVANSPKIRNPPSVRGCCSICDCDVLDTQPRQKDPITGHYQHEACLAAADAARTDAKVAAAAVAAKAKVEVAAIIAAAESARVEALAAANRQAQDVLAQAQADAKQVVAAAGSTPTSTTASAPAPAPAPASAPAPAPASAPAPAPAPASA